jgi:predicted lipoprotein
MTSVLLSACFEKPVTLDNQEVLQATVDQVILPDLDTLKRTAQDLHDNSVSFCSDPSMSRLQQVFFSWKGGKSMLKKIEVLNFGPYNFMDIDVSQRLDNWPERGDGIEEVLSGSSEIDAPYLRSLDQSVVSSGYPALGYLLNSGATDEEQLTALQDPRRCAYLMAQAEVNLEVILDFHDAWSPEGRDYASEVSQAGQGSSSFLSPEEAIGSLLMSMNRLVQHMADIKLAQPLDMGRSEAVEARFSGTSLRDLRSNLDAITSIYRGASPSISDFIVSQQEPALDTAIYDGLQQVQVALDEVPEPLSLSITTHPEKVAALIVSLESLSDVLSNDAERFLNLAAVGY